MDFNDARHIAKMRRREIMQYFEISKSTLLRYEASGKAPKAIIECLRMIGGELPDFRFYKDRGSFKGWYFGGGYLYSNNGDKFKSGDILAIMKDRELIKELSKEKKTIKIKNNVLPFPDRESLKKMRKN
jgi:hypothetical protein